MVSTRWLWRISRGIWANQNRRNTLNDNNTSYDHFIYTLKNNGPRIEPCGTISIILSKLYSLFLIMHTHWCLFQIRKKEVSAWASPATCRQNAIMLSKCFLESSIFTAANYLLAISRLELLLRKEHSKRIYRVEFVVSALMDEEFSLLRSKVTREVLLCNLFHRFAKSRQQQWYRSIKY